MLFKKNVWVAILFFNSLAAFSQNPSIAGFPTDSARVPFITGQVVISDGTKLSEPVAVQIVCGGRLRGELYSDTLGNFNFDLGKLEGGFGPQPADVPATAPS